MIELPVAPPGDRACAAALVAFVACVAAAYAGRRVLLKQRAARFARVDADGGSALLGQGAMNVFHWALQPVGAACIALGIGANAITFVSLALGAAAGVALANGMFGLGALLSGVSSMCDALDGLVARKTGTASDAGEVFDAAVNRYVELFFLGGLAYFYRDQPWPLAACLAALGGSFMVSYATAKAEALRVKAPRGSMRRPERAAYLVAGATLTPFLESYWTFTPMLGAIVLVAVVANYSAVARLYAIARALHKPRAAAAGPSHAGNVGNEARASAPIPVSEERS